MRSDIKFGNAAQDSTETRGWFVGSFMPDGITKSDNVEMKWGVHAAGEAREEWVTKETRTTVAILISGSFEMEFRDQSANLQNPGDYVMWGPGVDHRWRALADCVILTVRWPSAG